MRARDLTLRVSAVVASAALLGVALASAGGRATLPALARVAPWLAPVALLEAGAVSLNALALSGLLRAAGGLPPARPLWRAVWLGNVVATCLPLGRLLAEAWKATRLSRYVDGPTAGAGAAGLQIAVLWGNAIAGLLTLPCVARRCGATWPTLAVGAFALAMVAASAALTAVGRAGLGGRLGARFAILRDRGEAFDRSFERAAPSIPRAMACEAGARFLQVGQVALLLRALGRHGGAADALATQGLLLTGAAAGDALPGQLGATDALLTLGARRLDLPVADALALTLSLHGAQIGVALLGGAVALASAETA